MSAITESEWQEWNEVQKAVTQAGLVEDDLSAAIAILNRFLADDLPAALRREVIALRGTLCQEQGDLESAKTDFLAAVRLAAEGYVRFELEDTLAEISRKLGDIQDADNWYTAALETGASDPRVAGGGFLLRFLKFRGVRGLSHEEHQLAKKMAHQGWRLLRVEGEPDLGDLEGTAKQLVEAQRRPFTAERPPAPLDR